MTDPCPVEAGERIIGADRPKVCCPVLVCYYVSRIIIRVDCCRKDVTQFMNKNR